MRSGIHQAAGGVLFLRGALFRRQRLPLVARKADFVIRIAEEFDWFQSALHAVRLERDRPQISGQRSPLRILDAITSAN